MSSCLWVQFEDGESGLTEVDAFVLLAALRPRLGELAEEDDVSVITADERGGYALSPGLVDEWGAVLIEQTANCSLSPFHLA